MLNRTFAAQAQHAYDAALNSQSPDWRAVAELFRAAMRSGSARRAGKPPKGELADYNVDRVRLMCRSPRIAVRFMDGEAIFTHVPSAPGKPLNIGRALRVAIAMYRSRKSVQSRAGFIEYDRAMPCLRSSKCAAWKRTNCSTWAHAISTPVLNARAGRRNERQRGRGTVYRAACNPAKAADYLRGRVLAEHADITA
jgi:hypothetical protein